MYSDRLLIRLLMNSVCKQFCSASASAAHNVGRLPATLSRSLLVRAGPRSAKGGKKPSIATEQFFAVLVNKEQSVCCPIVSANASVLRSASSVSKPRSDRRLADLTADKALIDAREIRPRISGLLIVTVCPYQPIGVSILGKSDKKPNHWLLRLSDA